MSAPTYQCPVWCEIPGGNHTQHAHRVVIGNEPDKHILVILDPEYDEEPTIDLGPSDLGYRINQDQDLTPAEAREYAAALVKAADMADDEGEPNPEEINYRHQQETP